ncbi:hypothetical protein CPB84DRAFT_1795912 [Gymnopilus junonius]|uniref:Uncharacterized protein n=1 Tax=Gymnopilus junonius TaxID=109634 RepID=A0A9P5THB9_GYMJU|nr:hypothetical protein CPB84DRAFT_1795912 [Gymnopilus junonius]
MSLPMTLTIVTIFLMGSISAFFVSRLPLAVPRRAIDLYSWFSAFYGTGHELVADKATAFCKDTDFEDIVEYVGDLKVYFPV